MNQGVYEEDNYHLDGDYKAIHAARKTTNKTSRLPRQPEKVKKIDDPSVTDGIPAANGQETKPQQLAAKSVRDTIFAAAQDNNLDILRLYVGDNVQSLSDWCFRDPKTGETVLHRALASGSYQVVHFLLNNGRGAELASATYDENVDGQVSCRTTLHQATQSGNMKVVFALLESLRNHEFGKLLLSKRAMYMPNGRRPRSVTCLHLAAMNGFDQLVEHFVKVCGIDVNETNDHNDTALMWATLEGRRSTVELLISLKANANAANDHGSTALYYAVRLQDFVLVELLVKQGRANVNARRHRGLERPLVLAAAMGSEDIVRLLVTHGADVNVTVHGEETALHYAASEGHLEVCRMLIEHGAKIDAMDSMSETALLEAARRGQVEIVDYLVSNQADACKSTVRGNSTWTYAIEATDDRMLRVLLQHTSDDFGDVCTTVNSGTHKSTISLRLSHHIKLPPGFLPLHQAAKRGDTDKLKLLLSQDFSPDERDEHGNTFVHAAAAANQYRILELTAARLRASLVNKQGRTALHEACRLAHEKSVEELAKITPLEIKSSFGSTVLHEAVRSSNAKDRLSAVRYIMKYIQLGRYWSLLDAQDDRGYTALHWAVKGGCKELLPELRSLKLCVTDRDGNTPLHLAAAFSDTDTLDELVRLYPSDVKTAFQLANTSHMTPLRLAILQGSQGIIERAISAGADLAAIEPDQKTVLHWIAEKIIADNSRSETLMQTVKTIMDASVAWISLKKNEQMPEHPSDHYRQLKVEALTALLGNSAEPKGLTVFQYAATIGCIPLIQFISDLAHSVRNFDVDKHDLHDVSFDTVTISSQNMSKQKVHPLTDVSVAHKEIEVRQSPQDARSVSQQVMSVLELVVSNENSMSAAALLDINIFRHMASSYWCWYQILWSVLFLLHIGTTSLLTAYGVWNPGSSNDTKVPAANASETVCSHRLVPTGVAAFILFYALTVFVFLLVSSIIISRYDIPALKRQKSGEQLSKSSKGSPLYRYSDIVGQIIWNLCGLSFAVTTTLAVAWSYQLCHSYFYQGYNLSIALLFGWTYTIYYLTRLRFLYQFSLMLKLVFGDFLTFLLVYLLILLAFSAAQDVAILPIENYSHYSFFQTMFVTFQWLVGMNSYWEIDDPSTDAEKSRYVYLAVLYVAHISICTIVLVNMLIAAMSDSFTEIRQNSDHLWKVDSLRSALNLKKAQVFIFRRHRFYRLEEAARRLFYRLKAAARQCNHSCCQKHCQKEESDDELHLQWFLRFVNAGHQHTQQDDNKKFDSVTSD